MSEFQTFRVAVREPCLCPVCAGTGQYGGTYSDNSTLGRIRVGASMCHGCGGRGFVWPPEPDRGPVAPVNVHGGQAGDGGSER